MISSTGGHFLRIFCVFSEGLMKLAQLASLVLDEFLRGRFASCQFKRYALLQPAVSLIAHLLATRFCSNCNLPGKTVKLESRWVCGTQGPIPGHRRPLPLPWWPSVAWDRALRPTDPS